MIGDLFSNLFVIALLPAVGEELFFRGIVQKQFQELVNNRTAARALDLGFILCPAHAILRFYSKVSYSHAAWVSLCWSGSDLALHHCAFHQQCRRCHSHLATHPDDSGLIHTLGIEPGQELTGISVFMSLAGVWFLRKNLVANGG